MAYHEHLAERIRDLLADQPDLDEKKMFGGIAFLLNGNMAVGVSGNDLMVRIGPDNHEEALSQPGVEEFSKTGRPMKGWILATSGIVETDAGLAEWVERGVTFASTLPPK